MIFCCCVQLFFIPLIRPLKPRPFEYRIHVVSQFMISFLVTYMVQLQAHLAVKNTCIFFGSSKQRTCKQGGYAHFQLLQHCLIRRHISSFSCHQTKFTRYKRANLCRLWFHSQQLTQAPIRLRIYVCEDKKENYQEELRCTICIEDMNWCHYNLNLRPDKITQHL